MSIPKIKKLDTSCLDELRELIGVFRNVFEMGPGQAPPDSYFKKLLKDSSFVCVVAMLNNKVVGGATAYIMSSYYDTYSEAYLYDIAILKEHQRTGIGHKLIDFLKNYCSIHNIKTMFVEANEEDMEAVNFYHKTKASAEKVVHFNYYL